MVIIGYRSTLIGQAELNFTTCENCGTKNSYTVYVYGRYFHVFWIPILPIGKTYFAQCSGCEKAYSKEHLFPKEIREAFHTAKVRTPIKRPGIIRSIDREAFLSKIKFLRTYMILKRTTPVYMPEER